MDNTIIIHRTEDPFARIPKSLLDNPDLSWEAKGILAYLLGKPDGWKLRVTDIVNHGTSSEYAVRKTLNQARALGYASFEIEKGARNRFARGVWRVSDRPIFNKDAPFDRVSSGQTRRGATVSKNEGLSKKEVSKEPKEDVPKPARSVSPEWKPDPRSKREQLEALPVPKAHPSQVEFEALCEDVAPSLCEYRPDLYVDLCRHKWHTWDAANNRWVIIRNGRRFL